MRTRGIENMGEGKREKLRIERERIRLTEEDCKREEEEEHNLSEACLDTRDAGPNSTVGSGFTKFAISWIVLVLKSFPSRATLRQPPFSYAADTDLMLTEKMLPHKIGIGPTR